MLRRTYVGLIALSAASASLQAHPGHGVPELQNSVFHWLEPAHLGVGLSLLVAGLLTWGIFRSNRNRREKS